MAITQSTVVHSDGSTDIQVNVPFIAPPPPAAQCNALKPRIAHLSVAVSTAGGSIAGGQNLYYYLSGIDSSGNETIPSDPIEVIIPSGTNTNQVTISGLTPFDPNTNTFNVYRATTGPQGDGLVSNSTPARLFDGQTPPTNCSTFSVTDTGSNGGNGGGGDPTKMPIAQDLARVRAYWQLVGESQWRYGGETLNGSGTSVAFVVPHNIQGQQINIQLRAVDNRLNETPQSLAPTNRYTITAAYPAGLGVGAAPGVSDGLAIGGLHVFNTSGQMDKSTPLNVQGSLVSNFDNSAFGWSITTTSISMWSAAFTIPYVSGSNISVAAHGSSGSPAWSFTGLTPNSTYYFYVYWTISTGSLHVVLSSQSGGNAPELTSTIVQTFNGDGNIYVSRWTISTPASGGGSGGGGNGGGSCFSGNVEIMTHGKHMRFDEIGDRIVVVNETGTFEARHIVHPAREEELLEFLPGKFVTPNHPIKRGNCWVRASEAYPDAPVVRKSIELHNLHVRSKVAEDHHYILENGDVAHNYKPN